VPTGVDHKSSAFFKPQICLREFKMKEDDVSCLLKMQSTPVNTSCVRNNKAF